jgi:cytidylate kinase
LSAFPIVIITGSPGAGKTTVAARLAKAAPRGLHLPADVFFAFPAHPVSPYRADGHEQNTDIMIALARTAATFSKRGYEVFLDGIFGPWFLPVITEVIYSENIALEYVVLRAPLDITLRRVQAREGHGKDHIVRQMHAQSSDLGEYSGHASSRELSTRSGPRG